MRPARAGVHAKHRISHSCVLQLIGANTGRRAGGKTPWGSTSPDDCASLFLGPTLRLAGLSADGGSESRLDYVDGMTATGMQRAVPLPLTSDVDRELCSCLRGYDALDSTRVPGRVLSGLQRGQAFLKTRPLHESLPMSEEQRRAAIQRLQSLPFSEFPPTALDAALALWTDAGCAVSMIVLDEVESLEPDDAIAIGAYIAYTRATCSGGGGGGGGGTDSCDVKWLDFASALTPCVAVAFGVKAGVPIFMRRQVYEETVCRVIDLGFEGDADAETANTKGGIKTNLCIDPTQAATWRMPQTPRQFLERVQQSDRNQQIVDTARLQVWDLKAADVLELVPGQLRALLRANGVPTRRDTPAQELVGKLLPLMDEMERRLVRIRYAVEAEDYEEAARLAAGTSRRGRLSQLLVDAVREERYADAAELQLEMEAETMGRADITQDPGSYDPFLDADDWYMRDILKSKKRGHQ